MFRLRARVMKKNHALRETVVEDWLDKNIHDFQRRAQCRFDRDSFVEEIDFDYLEISVLEEDGLYPE